MQHVAAEKKTNKVLCALEPNNKSRLLTARQLALSPGLEVALKAAFDVTPGLLCCFEDVRILYPNTPVVQQSSRVDRHGLIIARQLLDHSRSLAILNS